MAASFFIAPPCAGAINLAVHRRTVRQCFLDIAMRGLRKIRRHPALHIVHKIRER